MKSPHILRFVAPAILLSVAALSRFEVFSSHLTPWMGAGFAMFSTIDAGSARHFRCVAILADGTERVFPLPHSTMQSDDAVVALHHPSDSALAPVARDIAARRCDAPADADVRRVRLELWSFQFLRETAALAPYRVTSREEPVIVKAAP